LSALYGLGEVLERVADDAGDLTLVVRVSAAKSGQLRRRFPKAEKVPVS
jgi:hypothetical protein